jgi:hypothetical protein
MSAERRTATGEGGRQETPRKGSAEDRSRPADAIQVGTRIDYDCHWCGTSADATYKEWPPGSGWVDWPIGCHKAHRADTDYLPDLAEYLGLERYATKPQIAAALRVVGRTACRRSEPPPLPTWETLKRWRGMLRGHAAPMRYLIETRGLTREVVDATRLGFDGTYITFPMFRGGDVVAVKRREPKPGAPMLKPAGSGGPNGWDWPLYPEPEPDARRRTFLVEGELDALRLRSVGLPATSVTGGVSQRRGAWVRELRGLRVVVAFDVEFEGYAERRAAVLRAAGIDA